MSKNEMIMVIPHPNIQMIAGNFQRWRHFLKFSASKPNQCIAYQTWEYITTPCATACAEYVDRRTSDKPALSSYEITKNYLEGLKEIESVCDSAKIPVVDANIDNCFRQSEM